MASRQNTPGTVITMPGGLEARAIGRSRGGMTGRIHAVADAVGNPPRFIPTPRQLGDITRADALIAGHVPGGKGRDARSLRNAITGQGAVAVIPARTPSTQVHRDVAPCRERDPARRFLPKIRRSRRIAACDEQTAAGTPGHAVHHRRTRPGRPNVDVTQEVRPNSRRPCSLDRAPPADRGRNAAGVPGDRRHRQGRASATGTGGEPTRPAAGWPGPA